MPLDRVKFSFENKLYTIEYQKRSPSTGDFITMDFIKKQTDDDGEYSDYKDYDKILSKRINDIRNTDEETSNEDKKKLYDKFEKRVEKIDNEKATELLENTLDRISKFEKRLIKRNKRNESAKKEDTEEAEEDV